MKKGLTEITVVMDKSGSMEHLTKDTIGGFNSFIEGQKKIPGDATLSLFLFGTEIYPLYENKDIKTINPITSEEYVADDYSTALCDAIGKTIDSVGARLSATNENDRPEKVLIVILTDGFENDSKKYNQSKIKEMVENQRKTYSWEFIFLGANMDAFTVGGSYGIQNNINYSSTNIGTRKAYETVCYAATNIRLGKSIMDGVSNDIRDNTNV